MTLNRLLLYVATPLVGFAAIYFWMIQLAAVAIGLGLVLVAFFVLVLLFRRRRRGGS